MTHYSTIVAEISGNHNGGLQRALDLVTAAKENGADFVKIQTYTPDSITLPLNSGPFKIPSDHKLWGGRSLYDLYQEAHTPLAWHRQIFDHARSLSIGCFSTPFDESAVEFLEDLGQPMYKIASLEIVDLPLIREVSRTGKPVILSTGAASLGEIESAVLAAKNAGSTDLTLLVCTSAYPAKVEDSNLRRMQVLKDLFDVKVGFSDHTLTSIALGASMVEKHLTLSRASGGVDSQFSMEPRELFELCRDARLVVDAKGMPSRWNTSDESVSNSLRPSLYVTRDVVRGERVSKDNVRSVRPSGGLPPDDFSLIADRAFSRDYKLGTPTSMQMFLN
jgi:pseudaminic acid synthase